MQVKLVENSHISFGGIGTGAQMYKHFYLVVMFGQPSNKVAPVDTSMVVFVLPIWLFIGSAKIVY